LFPTGIAARIEWDVKRWKFVMLNKSLQGQLLVASPHLPDPNFFRAVVLIIQHDEEGAFGLILNRPLDQTVAEIWELVADSPCSCQQAMNLGGPVEGQLTGVHCNAAAAARQVIPGVYFSIEPDELERVIRDPHGPFLLFSGYAGWGEGQLEQELKVGGWLTLAAEKELIFSHHEDMWKAVTARIGLDILAPMLKSIPLPKDPSCN
jgi:putative transcriptional regulator